MFNWLFGKKKEAVTENVVLDDPVIEETVEENPIMDKLFESFPELKRLCEMQFEMDQRIYKNSPDKIGTEIPKLLDVRYYKQLQKLPEISKVMSNGCLHHQGRLYTYLSVNNEYVTILKVDRYGYDIVLYTSANKINPPVLRVAENLSNNVDSWDMFINITDISKGTSEIVEYTEECIKNLKKGLSGYPMEIHGYIELRKYLIKGDIRISLSEKTLKVKSDKVNLSNSEIELLKEISLDYEHALIKKTKLEFEKEETQKRALMDQIVAELFKGE